MPAVGGLALAAFAALAADVSSRPTATGRQGQAASKIAFVHNPGCCAAGNRELFVMNGDRSADRAAREQAPAWSPDGRKIAFGKSPGSWDRGSAEIFVVNADGTGEQRLTRRPGHDLQPVWSPVRARR